MHMGPFADGSSHPSNLPMRAQLGPMFEELGIRVVLTSHDQSYERTLPLRGLPDAIAATDTAATGYDAADGVTWVKVSPAGKLSNRSGGFSHFQTDPPPYPTAFRDDTMHHFARITVTGGATILRAEAYGLPGDGSPARVIDSFEYSL